MDAREAVGGCAPPAGTSAAAVDDVVHMLLHEQPLPTQATVMVEAAAGVPVPVVAGGSATSKRRGVMWHEQLTWGAIWQE